MLLSLLHGKFCPFCVDHCSEFFRIFESSRYYNRSGRCCCVRTILLKLSERRSKTNITISLEIIEIKSFCLQDKSKKKAWCFDNNRTAILNKNRCELPRGIYKQTPRKQEKMPRRVATRKHDSFSPIFASFIAFLRRGYSQVCDRCYLKKPSLFKNGLKSWK